MTPRSNYVPLERPRDNRPPAWELVMDTLEDAYAWLRDSLDDTERLRVEVGRVLDDIRPLLMADGRLPSPPDSRHHNTGRQTGYRLRKLRRLTAEQMEAYRLFRHKSFSTAEALAMVRTPAGRRPRIF